MRLRFISFLFLSILTSTVGVFAPIADGRLQETSPDQTLTKTGIIRITSGLVVVPVSVTDPNGNAVKDLRTDDFAVDENSTPVSIAYLGEPETTRLDMVLAFDITISMRPYFKFEQDAATAFLKTVLRPGDSVSILCIDAKPRIVLQRSNSLQAALQGLDQITPSGSSTAFLDSVIAGAHMFQGPVNPDRRRVQIVFSDGEDNSSEQGLLDARREVQQADCIFYSINPGGPSIRLNVLSRRGQEGMEALAEQTGGVAFIAAKPDDLEGIYGRIATELQSLYVLSYYSPSPRTDGAFRSIHVRIPKHPEMRVRARQGYYPNKVFSP
jgi:Ca-activated chloride channel homolog